MIVDRMEQPLVLSISRSADRIWSSRQAMELAAQIGFAAADQWKIGIAVSELAANIARHAGAGTLTFRSLPEPDRGVEIVSVNSPEGKPEEQGKSGLRTGLAIIREVMDSCSIENGRPGEFTVTVRKVLHLRNTAL